MPDKNILILLEIEKCALDSTGQFALDGVVKMIRKLYTWLHLAIPACPVTSGDSPGARIFPMGFLRRIPDSRKLSGLRQ
jgi:hypothetical protein